jgi:hypothetical protein
MSIIKRFAKVYAALWMGSTVTEKCYRFQDGRGRFASARVSPMIETGGTRTRKRNKLTGRFCK